MTPSAETSTVWLAAGWHTLWLDPVYRLLTAVTLALMLMLTVQVAVLLVLAWRRRRREIDGLRIQEALRDGFHEGFETMAGREEWIERARRFSPSVVRDFLLTYIEASDGRHRQRLTEAYEALGLLDDDIARSSSGWWHQRTLAVRRLMVLSAPKSRQALLDRRRDVYAVRMLAAQAIARLGNVEDLLLVLRELKLPRRLMEQPLHALLKQLEPEAIARLVTQLDTFEDERVQRVVLVEAASMAPEACRARLTWAASSDAVETRVGAAVAAGALLSGDRVFLLQSLLEDDAWQVRAQAARSLGLCGDRRAAPDLVVALSDPSFWVRQNAAAALSALGTTGRAQLESAAAQSEDTFAGDAARQELQRLRPVGKASGGSR